MSGLHDKNGLTPKMLAFCRAYIETGNASEAYRKCYSTKNMKPETVNKRAYDLMRSGQISGMISSLKAETDSKATKDLGLSREWVIERLMKNAETGAKEMDGKHGKAPINLAAANKALELLGKVDTLQLFVDRSNVTVEKAFDDMTEAELDEFIARRLSN